MNQITVDGLVAKATQAMNDAAHAMVSLGNRQHNLAIKTDDGIRLLVLTVTRNSTTLKLQRKSAVLNAITNGVRGIET